MPAENSYPIEFRAAQIQLNAYQPPPESTRDFTPGLSEDGYRELDISCSSDEPVIRGGWFAKPVKEVLGHADGEIDMRRVDGNAAPLLWGHDSQSLRSNIGVIKRGWTEDGRLMATVRFANTPEANEIYERLHAGTIPPSVSIGYSIMSIERTEKPDEKTDDARITRWSPLEVSFCSIPADASVGWQRATEQRRDLFQSLTRTHEQSKQPEVKEMPTNVTDDETTPTIDDDVVRTADVQSLVTDAIRAERLAETERRTAIDAVFANHPSQGELRTACLLDADCTQSDAAKRLLDKLGETTRTDDPQPTNSGNAPYIEAGDDWSDKFRTAALDAIMTRGLENENYKGEGEKNEFRGYTVQNLAHYFCERNGLSTTGTQRQILERALLQGPQRTRMVESNLEQYRAGLSTTDFNFILMDATNKSLDQGYNEVEANWMQIAESVTLDSLSPSWRGAFDGVGEMEMVTENHEYPFMSATDEGKQVTLAKWGQQYHVSLEALMRDDLRQLTRNQFILGGAARRNETALVLTSVMSNPTMYDGNKLFDFATHRNEQMNQWDPAAPNPAMNLRESIRSMRYWAGLQVNPLSNRYLNVELKTVLCGLGLEEDLDIHFNSRFALQAGSLNQEPNPLFNKYSIISHAQIEQWLERLVAAGELPTTDSVIMLSQPSEFSGAEVYHLRGHESPELFTKEGFDIDGWTFKVRHWLAAAATKWQGFQRHTIDINAANIRP